MALSESAIIKKTITAGRCSEDISRKAISSGIKELKSKQKAALTPPKQATMFEIPVEVKRLTEDSEGNDCGRSIILSPGIPLVCPRAY